MLIMELQLILVNINFVVYNQINFRKLHNGLLGIKIKDKVEVSLMSHRNKIILQKL